MKISFLVRARRMRADGREEAVEESRIDYIDIRKRQSVVPYLLGPTNTHSHPWKGEDSILYGPVSIERHDLPLENCRYVNLLENIAHLWASET